ncbi:syntaxin-18 [Orussus abietinus]|uniref:syntaxin-18 n=1 Tax=Orussus abietinus TaxID=222816 RepID=UPI00062599C8|nr:syntaxin-18 [Orussus abietinus]
MDISNLFKACVKTVRLRNKALDFPNESIAQSRILKARSAFFTKASDVVTQVTKLREFLLNNRSAYLNFSGHLSSLPQMTDVDRDEIDIGAQKIMSTCSQLIKELKREVMKEEVSQQNLEHREIMLLLIEEYLKNVCKIYSEQKAIRVKRTVEMRKLVKIEPDIKPSLNIDRSSRKQESTDNLSTEKNNTDGSAESSPMKILEINGDVNTLTYEEELSPEDIQMFESENQQLFNELNTLTEEIKQIESKVVHIAELQEIFTEKVLDQDKDLDRLMTTVVGSTENVKEANEQIRQAIQRNAGLRVSILFFLLVMSFSLLFLDWYNA